MRKGFLLAIIPFLLLPPSPLLSLSSEEVLKLKRAGVTDEVIEALIEEERASSPFITAEDVIRLKEAGISDGVILRMLEKVERERARYSGVSRVIRREDGKEVIVYGSPSEPPWPETRYHYYSTDGKAVLVIPVPPEGEERRGWEVLKGLHLDLHLQEVGR